MPTLSTFRFGVVQRDFRRGTLNGNGWDENNAPMRCKWRVLPLCIKGFDDPVSVEDVLESETGVEAAAYVQVEEHASLDCGRLSPLDSSPDVSQYSCVGFCEVASHRPDTTIRVGRHPP